MIEVWGWFCELSQGRSSQEPIRYTEIKSWAELTGEQPSPSEVRIIKKLDHLYMMSAHV